MIDTPTSARPRRNGHAGLAAVNFAGFPGGRVGGGATGAAPRHGPPTGLVGHRGTDRILVIGDVILDRYVWDGGERGGGPPVLVLRAAGTGPWLLGPGARATLVGVAGDDAEGEAVRRLLRAAGVPRVAPAALRGHRFSRLDLARWLPPLVAEHDFTLVSAHGRDAGGPGLLADVLGWADAAGRPVLVDPAPGGAGGRGANCRPPDRSVARGGRAPGRRGGTEAVAVTLDPAEPAPAWAGAGGLILVVPGASPAEGPGREGGRRRANQAADGSDRVEGEGRRCRAT